VPVLRRTTRSERPFLPAAQRLRTLTDDVAGRLAEGQLELVGRLVNASNASFVADLLSADQRLRVVYKPTRGERPLDDFPYGTLAARERAAYLLSEATGWQIVPPTVMRDGPLGHGMVQLWVDVDDEIDVVGLINAADPRLRRIVLFDALANNADRKAGHLLAHPSGLVQGVDHGICFAVAPKLRTVLWAWRGQPLEPAELSVVADVRHALDAGLGGALAELLSAAEVNATRRRADALLAERRFPQPDPRRPAIPWPPY
jgi:uncharacterized repeat protein (TIGR03843 family)